MSLIEKVWFKRTLGYRLISLIFVPFMLLFWILSTIRKLTYQWNIKNSIAVEAPVIIVGNISVGGNGKTPLVVTIVEWLIEAGYKPGVLSRGYGGKTIYPASVDDNSQAAQVGDEPMLMKHRLSCPIVVDPIRPRGAKFLVEQHQCNVIVCDDGLQHYRLKRDIEIAVVDGVRLYGNGCLLPMGPLRETRGRLGSVDFVVFNGKPNNQRLLQSKNHFFMDLVPTDLVNLADSNLKKPLTAITNDVVALAAIGYPQRFFDLLSVKGIKLKKTLSFVDHHQFSEQDIPQGTILMTEKDAVKCRQFAQPDWWFLPVDAQLSEQFKLQLFEKLAKFKR